MNKREQKEAGLISMIWPIIIELIITGLIANVNLVILNSFSSNAVAVIGSGSQIIVVIINIYGIVSIGTSIILAHTVGAKHYDDCNQLISTALFVNFIFGICLSLVGVIFIPSMLKFINMPKELVGMAKQYLLVCIGFSFLQALLMTLNAIFRSLGEMKKVLITMVTVNLLCLILNKLVSVYIPRDSQNLMQYTFTGMISQLVGIVIFIIMLYQNKTINYKFSIKDLPNNASRYLIKILRYGIPGGLEGIIYLISQTIVVSFVGILGMNAMLTRAFVGNVTFYMSMTTAATAAGSSILIGHLIGSGNIKKVDTTCKKVIIISLCITSIICVVLTLLGPEILMIYTKDVLIINLALKILIINCILEVIRCVTGNLVAVLKAVGDVNFTFGIVIIGSIMNIAISYYFAIYLGMGLVGIWYGYIGDVFFRGILCWIRFKRAKWIKNCVQF